MANELGAGDGLSLLWNPGPLGPVSVLVLGRITPTQPPLGSDLWQRLSDWNSAHAGQSLSSAFSDPARVKTGQELLNEMRLVLGASAKVLSMDPRWDLSD